MTPEEKENALRAQARRCAEEITKAMSVKPKPKWNAVCPPHPSQALREGKADGCQPGEICQCYWPHEWAVWSGIMKERGMIFNAEMVRAILDGRKTQTRRIVKGADGAVKFSKEWDINGEEIFVVLGEKDHTGMNPVLGAISCPLGAVGDRIWVRETWGVVSHELDEDGRIQPWTPDRPAKVINEMPFGNGYYSGHAIYAADGDFTWGDDDGYEDGRSCWKPSIHMPRAASRILLEITDVRVERLNAISEEDAIAEGMQGVICPCCKGDSEYSTSQYDSETLAVVDEIPCRACESNRSKFFTLWDSIYGYGQHCIGEWVWVIEFKRVEGGAA